MPFLHEQVTIINDLLKSSLNDERFAGTYWGTIAKDVTRPKESGGLETFPGSVDVDGKERYYGFDDNYPMVVYHKPQSISFQKEKFDNLGKFSMKMVIQSTQAKVKMTGEQLQGLFTANFPNQIDRALYQNINIGSMKATLERANLNQRQVWGEEFQNIEYKLGVEHILFSINYTIETRFKNGCLSVCDC